MQIEAVRTQVRERRWHGTLPSAQVCEILLKTLRTELGAPLLGTDLTIALMPSEDDPFGLTFDLVHNEDWLDDPRWRDA